MKTETLDCASKPDCPYLHPKDLGWCNRLPVWYETEDRSVVKCTSKLAQEANKDGKPLFRCERVFPLRPCKYTRTLV